MVMAVISNLDTEKFAQWGAENAHHLTWNSLRKYLSRTSPVQLDRQRSFSVKIKYW
jgi:hypothetical protein